ncbi:MAG TPA: hypothetical protein VHX19_16170 [Stellaceae bacterium]|nr:hypothetical protein [Stellaceae bacterium]
MLVLVLALLPSGAFASRQEPIYNVINHPIPAAAQKLSRDAISKAIIAGGALTRRWQIGPNTDGTLTGTLDVRGKHHATATITYSQTSYNITLVSSTNLLQEGNLIHRNYNRWVHDLEKDIDAQLTAVGTAAR